MVNDMILTFIEGFHLNGQRKQVIETFMFGYCYWFAHILKTRFTIQNPVIVYDQVDNHFGCRIDGEVYDITGIVTDSYEWESWLDLMDKDPALSKRIMRDCIFKFPRGDE